MSRFQCQTFEISPTRLDEGIYAHFLSSHNSALRVLAGYGASTGSRSGIDTTPLPLNGSSWNKIETTLPLGIIRLDNRGDVAVSVLNKMYMFNPYTSGGTASSYHELFIYDLSSEQYSVGTRPPFKAIRVCTVHNANNAIIYVLGGFDNVYFKYTQRYNVQTGQWLSRVADIKIARYRAGCSLSADMEKLYLFGGYDGSFFLDSIERYNVSADEWTVIGATLSEKRYQLKCRLMASDNIYCIGGRTGGSTYSNTVDVFDPHSETITNTMQLNVGRGYFGAALWNDAKCLLVVGGRDEFNTLDSIESIGNCSGLFILYILLINIK